MVSKNNAAPNGAGKTVLQVQHTIDILKKFLTRNECNFFVASVPFGKNDTVFYSENVLSITGYTPSELNEMPGRMYAIIFEEDLQAVKKFHQDALFDSALNKFRMDYRIIRKDKEIVWLSEDVIAERDDKGNTLALNSFAYDITALKNNEFENKKTLETLTRMNNSKDRFISILSHDLRAPFTSILGFSEILMNEPNLPNAERLEYLTYINDSSQNQLQLINYLLDWSRLQTGRLKIEPHRISVQNLIFNCVSSLTGNAIRKNIEIKVDADDSLFVQADERLLTQAITNLISNAVKFSPENNTIEIAADFFNDELIEFIVKDSGLGISDANKEKLFKVEKMFSTEGTKGEKGTGLGLSLVKEIIEKHGGEIWYYSEVGKGSEFHFTIPGSKNIILIVDEHKEDWSENMQFITQLYPSFKLITACSGYEALKIIIDEMPSLVITSHEMPLMNGPQLVEAIRREDIQYKIPVIVISETNDGKVEEMYDTDEIIDILTKPLDKHVLKEKLKLVLN